MDIVEHCEVSESSLCEAMIAVMSQVRPDFPIERVRQQLAELVAEARCHVSAELDQEQQLEQLLDLFYQQWGFRGAEGIYRLSDAIWLDNLLQTRQGTAVSLGAVLMFIAGELSLPLLPVIFPTQLIVRADWVEEALWLINPFNGDTLDEHTLDVWVKGTIGPTSTLFDEDLDEAEVGTVVRKMLETLKSSLMEEQQPELALQVSEVLLTMDPEDPYEIRDRGLIYAQLECEHIALNDLNYFIEQCPEDPVSEMIKVQIHAIGSKHVTLH